MLSYSEMIREGYPEELAHRLYLSGQTRDTREPAGAKSAEMNADERRDTALRHLQGLRARFKSVQKAISDGRAMGISTSREAEFEALSIDLEKQIAEATADFQKAQGVVHDREAKERAEREKEAHERANAVQREIAKQSTIAKEAAGKIDRALKELAVEFAKLQTSNIYLSSHGGSSLTHEGLSMSMRGALGQFPALAKVFEVATHHLSKEPLSDSVERSL